MNEARIALKAICDNRKQLAALEADAVELRTAIAGQEGDLQKKIKDGQTTGDPIVDFILVSGSFDGRFVSRYDGLQKALSGHVGQMVLVQKVIETAVAPILNINRPRTRFFCGVLAGEQLMFTTRAILPHCSLPTAGHLMEGRTVHDLSRFPESAIDECNVLNMHGYLGIFVLDGLDPKDFCLTLKEEQVARIFVGDAAVAKWFADNRSDTPDYFDRCRAKLGLQTHDADAPANY